MRVKSYSELFEERGASYDLAMRRYPNARRAEFEQVLEHLTIEPGMRVGDIPAGGGYLRTYLPEGAIWEGHEPCASFLSEGADSRFIGDRPLLPLPWDNHELDVVLSLAGVHHLDDKADLFREIARVIIRRRDIRPF